MGLGRIYGALAQTHAGSQRLISIEHNEVCSRRSAFRSNRTAFDRLRYIFKPPKYPGYSHGYGQLIEEHFFRLRRIH